MSSGDGGTNWKTNVNRAKTKRWVEAKSYTYDGDDWGDADEYGEYGGYDDEPEPPPRPTGLRKTGSPASNAQAQQYQVPPSQQQQLNQPLGQPQPLFKQADRERTNSFGRGDDRVAFSGSPNASFAQAPINRSGSPASRAQPSNPIPQNRMRAPSDGPRMHPQPRPSFDQAGSSSSQGYPNRPSGADGSRSQSLTTSSVGDYQRRDFSPAAISMPIQARPPRKSSLGQSDIGPAGPVQPIQTNIPQTGSQPQSPEQPSAATPTFVRPADIYRRMQEEKERERLSQESSRPSLDILQKSRDHSPANTSDTERKQRKPALESVAERKSEYGMEGLLAANSMKQTTESGSSKTGPVLPQISAFESFGQGFGESFMSAPGAAKPQNPVVAKHLLHSDVPEPSNVATTTPDPSLPKLSEPENIKQPADTLLASSNLSPENTLHHQGSLGFRSAVNQAFDSQIPPTPTSTTDSSLDRSNSESTNDISPIISRNTSGAAVRPNKEEIPSITSIAEEPASTPRASTPTSRPIGDRPDSKGSLQAIKQGHRRNLSTPSPDNSPARTPNVEVNRQLQSPQEAELAMTTPTTTSHTTSSASDKLKQEDSKPGSRAGSPSKGRVRDLVDKIDSAGNSRRGSDTSLKEKSEQAQRPKIEPNESFRPQLPGGWSSYTTNDINLQRKGENEPAAPETRDSFAAAAVAGDALAGALAAAVGIKADGPYAEKDEEGAATPKEAPRISNKNLVIHPEAQRLSLPRNDSDAPSSIVPTPMSMKPEGPDKQEYFTPVTPLNQRRQPSGKELPQLENTKAYDDMSTESSPNDLESDRLRKELVRELSPQAENFNHAPRSEPQDESFTNQRQGHESTFLPSEYESYWNNGTTEGGEASRKASELGSLPTGSPSSQLPEKFSPIDQGLPTETYPQPQHLRGFSGPQIPPPVSNQPPKVTGRQVQSPGSESGVLPSALNDLPLSRRFSWEGPSDAGTGDTSTLDASSIAAKQLKNEITSESTPPPPPKELPRHEHTPSIQSVPDVNKELPKGPVGLDGDEGTSLGGAPPGFISSTDFTTQPDFDDAAGQQSQLNKVPAFREIMGIKDVNVRLRTYDTTREQFANMNTGLSSWIQATINSHPEHAELLRNGGSFGPQVRSVATPAAKFPSQGVSPSPASKSPFNPGATKITSQKGKDLLHTAGVFSGKANTAAKGFFSKGRNKLRGMGGDKAPKMFRRPSYPIASIEANSSPLASNTIAQPVPTTKTNPSHIPLASRSFTEPPGIAFQSSFESHSPTFPPPDQADSPTLGVEPLPESETPRASFSTPVSPMSATESSENRRASLQQRKMSQGLSTDDHATLPSDVQTRLTIHQNQMRSFEESFPPDLIIPAKYQNLPAYPNNPKRKAADDNTPTQADFPADANSAKSQSRGSSVHRNIFLQTETSPKHTHGYDAPANPDYVIAADRVASEDGLVGNDNEEGRRRASSLSFIHFTDVQSEGFALQVPQTPDHLRLARKSQEAFDETAFESPERDLGPIASADSRHSVQYPKRSTSDFSNEDDSKQRSASANSSLQRVHTNYGMNESSVEQLDSPTIPTDTFRVREHEEVKKQPTVSLFPKTKRRSQQLASALKVPNPVLQEVPPTPGTEVEIPPRLTSKRKQRSSVLGNIGIRGLENSPKSRLGFHKRTGTDVTSYDVSSLTPERKIRNVRASTEPEPQILQRSATLNQSPLEKDKKKSRFSGLSSFINKANPRRQGSDGANTIRTISPFQRSKLDSTPERQQYEPQPLYGAQKSPQAEAPRFENNAENARYVAGPVFRAQPEPPSTSNDPAPARNTEQRQKSSVSSVQRHRRRESDAGQPGVDYKSVFPPEFYAGTPPAEGYYGLSPGPGHVAPGPADRQQAPEPSATSSTPRTAYAATSSSIEQGSIVPHSSKTKHKRSPSSSHDQNPTPQLPSPQREAVKSIDSNLFDIETPPPPPPKDERWSKPSSKKRASSSQVAKRNSTPTSTTKVTFSSSPATTTTTTTTTSHKRLSNSKNSGRSRHRSSSSVGALSTSPASSHSPAKPARSSFRRSLPPLQTKNIVGDIAASPQMTKSSGVPLSATTWTTSPNTTTVHAPAGISTTTVTSKYSKSLNTPNKVQSASPELARSGQAADQTPLVSKTNIQHIDRSVEQTTKEPAPPPRQGSPVEKMKDEPRSASHVDNGNEDAVDSEEEIVMSSTAYPGQEWRPDFGYGGWEGD